MTDKPDPALLARMRLALRHLPRRQREILLAIRHEDASYQELAERTGLTADAVQREFADGLAWFIHYIDHAPRPWWRFW